MKRSLSLILILCFIFGGCAHKKDYVTLDRTKPVTREGGGLFTPARYLQNGERVSPVSLVGGLNDISENSRHELEKAGLWQALFGATATAAVFSLGIGLGGSGDADGGYVAAAGFSLLALFFGSRAVSRLESSVDEYNKAVGTQLTNRADDGFNFKLSYSF